MRGAQIRQRFSPELVAQWEALREQFDTSDACLQHVLTQTTQPRKQGDAETLEAFLTVLDLTDSEREVVADALNHSSLPWQLLFKTGILTRMRALSPNYKPRTPQDVDLSNPQERRYVHGASALRCRQILDEVMAANNAATSSSARRYITRTVIAELAGCSPAIAIKFCRDNAQEILEHNTSMGFISAEAGRRHNQWVYKGGTSTNGTHKV